ncbi:MAG: beta-ketoacyl-ACP reductase [FCB group bacterium]|nr:beta-ketoacyl-ACP reductase [FCB group bacterium]
MRLKDKTAIITGSGRGIGETTAKKFAAEGASIIAADIDMESAIRTVEEIKSKGGKALAVKVDVTDKVSVEAMVEAALKEFGKIDILINNAGVTRDALAMRMKEADWDLVLDINLKGTFLCCQAVIRPMRKTGGRIVNTSSIAALGNVGQINYSASKGGVISLTKTLALELARSNINVNCVAPGPVMTPMFESVPENLREEYIKQIPLGRFAQPEDIANAHLFLCSEEAAYITGQVLFVDGGISAGV